MWSRLLSGLLLAALLSAACFPPASPADEKDKAGKTKSPNPKPTPVMLMFQGRIKSIDLDKNELVLGEAVQSRFDSGKKEKKADQAKGSKATPPIKSLTFKLPPDARITLDGVTVKLKALQAGYYARVQAVGGRASLDRRDVHLVADRKETPAPVVLTAKRVDASRKAFTIEKGKR